VEVAEFFAIVRCNGGFDIALIESVPEEALAYRILGFGLGETQGAFVFEPWSDRDEPTLLLRRRSATPADELELARLVATGAYRFVNVLQFEGLRERELIDDDGYATSLGEETFTTVA
jgi:hypothetical protein